MTGGNVEETLRERMGGGPWQQFRHRHEEGALEAVLHGGLMGQMSGAVFQGSSDWGPEGRGPAGGALMGTLRVPERDTPPPQPRVPDPCAPSLTGAGVSAGRRPRGGGGAAAPGRPKGPTGSAAPSPPRQPRAACLPARPEAEVAPVSAAPAWRRGDRRRRRRAQGEVRLRTS